MKYQEMVDWLEKNVSDIFAEEKVLDEKDAIPQGWE